MSDSLRNSVPPFEVEMRNEPTYSFRSAGNNSRYEHEYALTGNHHQFTSRHGVRCSKNGEVIGSAVLGASGGASGVHHNSMVLRPTHCFVAVGPYIAALALPLLTLVWSRQVDSATCFGVHFTSDRQALLSHGELELARVTFDGTVAWTAGGADVFTEGLLVNQGVVRVTDFEGRCYCFDEVTGRELA